MRTSSVFTKDGRRIEIISEADLQGPIVKGQHLRVFCHLHGGDHQRSLSLDRQTGWGYCFNASCQATVLVQEWNPDVAARLLRCQQSAPANPSRLRIKRPSPQKHIPSPQSSASPWQEIERAALLSIDPLLRQALTSFDLGDSWQAQAYLLARGIPLDLAEQAGVGYFPAELLDQPELRQSRRLLQRWVDRLLFPLTAPSGKGYIGRSLWRWQMGMDEDVHKALLEEQEERRWIKTNPAGWFCPSPLQLASRIVLVEGPFDRLALLAGGFEPQEVVALAGTTAQPSWFPDQVHSILLALDNDSGGREASRRLADAFARTGRAVLCCPPPQDAGGKDWNQRWQKLGPEGIRPLYEAVTGGDSHPQDLQKSRPGTAQ